MGLFLASEDYRFVEFFAGDSNVSYALRLAGFPGLSVDVRYSASLDITTDAGYALCIVALAAHGSWKSCDTRSSLQQLFWNEQAPFQTYSSPSSG